MKNIDKVIVVFPMLQAKMRPFYYSMRHVLGAALTDLGLKSQFHIFDHRILGILGECGRRDAKIFLMSPKTFCQLQIRVGRGPSYLWCFEPIKYLPEHNADAGIEDQEAMVRLLKKKKVNEIWIYDNKLCSTINNDRVFWMPCGFHKSLCVEYDKKKDEILMLGNLTSARKRLIAEFNALSKIKIDCNLPFIDLLEHLKEIGSYRFTVYVPVSEAKKSFIPCHRILIFASMRVLIFSNIKLEPILDEGTEYVFYSGVEDLYNKYTRLLDKKELVDKITNNAFVKISTKYDMTEILKNRLGLL